MPKIVIKHKHQGKTQIEPYIGDGGKIVYEKIKGAIEEDIFALEGKAIAGAFLQQSLKTLFISAMFFQRLVARTPLDEDYIKGKSKKGKPLMHHADDERIKDHWIASYRNKVFTSKYFQEKGCTFERYNDRAEVLIIYNEFLSFLGKGRLAKGEMVLRQVHIDNDSPYYPTLEYGEYVKDGTIKTGPKRKHGVTGGYSVQAPAGIYRYTRFELFSSLPTISINDLMSSGRNWQRGLKRTGSIKTLAKFLQGKSHITFTEACEIARQYQLE